MREVRQPKGKVLRVHLYDPIEEDEEVRHSQVAGALCGKGGNKGGRGGGGAPGRGKAVIPNK